MTIRELITALQENASEVMSAAGRMRYLLILCNETLSQASRRSLEKFQDQWGEGSYEQFNRYQNQLIVGLLEIEVTEVGADLRAAEGLEPLTPDSEVPELLAPARTPSPSVHAERLEAYQTQAGCLAN